MESGAGALRSAPCDTAERQRRLAGRERRHRLHLGPRRGRRRQLRHLHSSRPIARGRGPAHAESRRTASPPELLARRLDAGVRALQRHRGPRHLDGARPSKRGPHHSETPTISRRTGPPGRQTASTSRTSRRSRPTARWPSSPATSSTSRSRKSRTRRTRSTSPRTPQRATRASRSGRRTARTIIYQTDQFGDLDIRREKSNNSDMWPTASWQRDLRVPAVALARREVDVLHAWRSARQPDGRCLQAVARLSLAAR